MLAQLARCTVSFMAYPAKTDRAQILAAAMTLVEKEGVENLAIRSVASLLGLAPNALYRYFSSLADLELAVGEEARLQVLEAMQHEVAGLQSPAETIWALCRAYLRFAHERPRVFAFYLKTPENHTTRTPQCESNTAFFLEHVTRIYGEKRAWDASHALWALLHGMAVLGEADVLTPEQLDSGFRFGLQMWIDGAAYPTEERV